MPFFSAVPPALLYWLPGSLLLLMLSLALTSILIHAPWLSYIAGAAAWVAGSLLLERLQPSQRMQTLVLFSLGLVCLLIGLLNGAPIHYLLNALEANQILLAMLVGVSFLRLLAQSGQAEQEQLPKGRRALWQTLLGCHLIGAVINMSALVIIGDRLSRTQPMNTLQGLILVRAFSICACWSPFFASMGVVFICSPEARLGEMLPYALPLSLVGLLVSAFQIARHPEVDSTVGYPMHWQALRLPLLLAGMVMLGQILWPQVSVLTLVTLIALLSTLIGLPILRGRKQALAQFKVHLEQGLPEMKGEVTLFLGAAMLAAGVSALLESLHLQLAPDHFGGLEASLTLITLTGLAVIGLHPVTSSLLASSLLAPSNPDPSLLGLTLLMGWAIGVSVSPFSGVQLSLQGRYGVRLVELLRLNTGYGPLMVFMGCGLLYLYAYVHSLTSG
ncbi:hypothetical protein LX59_02184 [Azomonas agilis]|uniref:Uncharacterized protein n=1 Tax=Azomonas agilis TaxID=116849 RepID=A0A562I1Z1_9GAMM|nr:hypothetical protein [Azomonas agilis]TWH64836.1 hypothetical protein LX59_02184 [Azomonas agilis]